MIAFGRSICGFFGKGEKGFTIRGLDDHYISRHGYFDDCLSQRGSEKIAASFLSTSPREPQTL